MIHGDVERAGRDGPKVVVVPGSGIHPSTHYAVPQCGIPCYYLAQIMAVVQGGVKRSNDGRVTRPRLAHDPAHHRGQLGAEGAGVGLQGAVEGGGADGEGVDSG